MGFLQQRYPRRRSGAVRASKSGVLSLPLLPVDLCCCARSSLVRRVWVQCRRRPCGAGRGFRADWCQPLLSLLGGVQTLRPSLSCAAASSSTVLSSPSVRFWFCVGVQHLRSRLSLRALRFGSVRCRAWCIRLPSKPQEWILVTTIGFRVTAACTSEHGVRRSGAKRSIGAVRVFSGLAACRQRFE
jgi:hypothetical protein